MKVSFVVAAALLVFAAACGVEVGATLSCEAGSRLGILAQAVPSASFVPCVETIPAGWSFNTLDVERGEASFWLNHDRAGLRAVEVELTESCDVTGAVEAPRQEEGAVRYQRLSALSPRFAGSFSDVFPGGCVTYRFDFERGPHTELLQEGVDDAIALFPRDALNEEREAEVGVPLDPETD